VIRSGVVGIARGAATEQAPAAELRRLLAVSQRWVAGLAVVVGVARTVALVLLTGRVAVLRSRHKA
jgi:hypothetical protein